MKYDPKIEDFIMARLPATYGRLCAELCKSEGDYAWRMIDRGLQRLRKRGAISFVRTGNKITWSPLPQHPAKGEK